MPLLEEMLQKYGSAQKDDSGLLAEMQAKYGAQQQAAPASNLAEKMARKYAPQPAAPQNLLAEMQSKYGVGGQPQPPVLDQALKPPPGITPFAKPTFGQAFRHGIDQPLEAAAETFKLFGAQGLGESLSGAVEAPEGYQSASGQFAETFNPKYLPRAVVEQSGQIIGSLASRLLGGLAGGAIGSAIGGGGAVPGAAIGAFAGPFLFEAIQIAGPSARERARNNGRDEPNAEDIGVALLTASGSGALNAVGAKYLPGGSRAVHGVLRSVLNAAFGEGVTEAAQSVVQQIGETGGTLAGLQVSPRQFAAEGIIGGLTGGTLAGTVEAATGRPDPVLTQRMIERELPRMFGEGKTTTLDNGDVVYKTAEGRDIRIVRTDALPVASDEAWIGSAQVRVPKQTEAAMKEANGDHAAARALLEKAGLGQEGLTVADTSGNSTSPGQIVYLLNGRATKGTLWHEMWHALENLAGVEAAEIKAVDRALKQKYPGLKADEMAEARAIARENLAAAPYYRKIARLVAGVLRSWTGGDATSISAVMEEVWGGIQARQRAGQPSRSGEPSTAPSAEATAAPVQPPSELFEAPDTDLVAAVEDADRVAREEGRFDAAAEQAQVTQEDINAAQADRQNWPLYLRQANGNPVLAAQMWKEDQRAQEPAAEPSPEPSLETPFSPISENTAVSEDAEVFTPEESVQPTTIPAQSEQPPKDGRPGGEAAAPTLTSGTAYGGRIRLGFDALAGEPDFSSVQKAAQEIGAEIEITPIEEDVFSASRGEKLYRIEVTNARLQSDPALAEQLFQRITGQSKTFQNKTAFQDSLPVEDRFKFGVERAAQRVEREGATYEKDAEGWRNVGSKARVKNPRLIAELDDRLAQEQEQPAMPQALTGIDAINASADVKVTAPKGATFIRGTDEKGNTAEQPVGDFRKFNPFRGANMVKLEAGTRGRKGEFIPMDGDVVVEEKGGGQFSVKRVTPEQDRAYMAAVNAGDMETAQRMVDEAANWKPSSKRLWRVVWANPETGKKEVYADNLARERAEYLANQVTNVLSPRWTERNIPTSIEQASGQRRPDPVARDDQGNVIPLSQRFNEQQEDIRYSVRQRNEDLARMSPDVRAAVEDAEKRYGVTFEGMQRGIPGMADQYTFTDNRTESTGYFGSLDELPGFVERQGQYSVNWERNKRRAIDAIRGQLSPYGAFGKALHDITSDDARRMASALESGKHDETRFREALDPIIGRKGVIRAQKVNVRELVRQAMTGERPMLDVEADLVRLGLDTARATELRKFLQTMAAENNKRNQLLADEARRLGWSDEMVAALRSNMYQTRSYLRWLLGDAFTPMQQDIDEAAEVVKGGILEGIADIATRAQKLRGVRNPMPQFLDYLNGGDPAIMSAWRAAGLSADKEARIVALRQDYLRVQDLLHGESLQDVGTDFTATAKTDALEQAALDEVKYHLTKEGKRVGSSSAIPQANLREQTLEKVWQKLYGMVDDPKLSQGLTRATQERVIGRIALMNRLFAEGQDVWWWNRAREDTEYLGAERGKITRADRMKYGDMAGKYVTKDLFRYLHPELNNHSRVIQALWHTPMASMRLMALLAPKAISRNWITATINFAVQSGDYRMKGYLPAFMAGNRMMVRMWGRGFIGKQEPGDMAVMARLARLGVFHPSQSAWLYDVAQNMRQQVEATTKLGKAFQNSLRRLGKAYALIDLPTKYAAFEVRKQEGIRNGMTEEQAEQYAAQHVRDLYQNRENIPKIFGTVSKLGIADYVGYTADSIRISVNALRRGIDKAKQGDPTALMDWSLARALQGVALVGAGAPLASVWAAIHKAVRGDDDDEQELLSKDRYTALGTFMPEYYEFMPGVRWEATGKDGSKKLYYTNFGGQTAFPAEDWLLGAVINSPSLGEIPERYLNNATLSLGIGMFPEAIYTLLTGDVPFARTANRDGLMTLGKEDRDKGAKAVDALLPFMLKFLPGAAGQAYTKLRRVEAIEGRQPIPGTLAGSMTPEDVWAGALALIRTYRVERNDFANAVLNKMRTFSEPLRLEKEKLSRPDYELRRYTGPVPADVREKAEGAQYWYRHYLKQLEGVVKTAKVAAPSGWITDREYLALLQKAGLNEREQRAVLRGTVDRLPNYRRQVRDQRWSKRAA